MEVKQILERVDHTCLKQEAGWEDIKRLCDEAIEYHTASVCIPPSYVKEAYAYTEGKLNLCTVIGFPNGYQTTAVKVFETENAIQNHANEIDMVINIGWVKDKRWNELESEIKAVKAACGPKVLKVIIEACLLTEEEKVAMCKVVANAGADYIKTSTGFSHGGATKEDIDLFAKNIGAFVKIKAAGGINSMKDAVLFIEAGADRLGTSKIVSLVKSIDVVDGY